jgi:hypothetical protein
MEWDFEHNTWAKQARCEKINLPQRKEARPHASAQKLNIF